MSGIVLVSNGSISTTGTDIDRVNFLYSDEYFEKGRDLRYGVIVTCLLCISYISVIVLGILGNILVIVVVKTSKMNSLTNQFIANLAVADLLVNLLCLPFTLAANLYTAWTLGLFFCKAVAYLQGVSVSASVNFLMAISIERCIAIAFPLSGTMSSRQYKVSVACIWIFALIINLPWLFVFTIEPLGNSTNKLEICLELWPSRQTENIFFVLVNLIVCYLIPLAVISVCYLIIWKNVVNRNIPGERIFRSQHHDAIYRSRVKVIKMVLVVVITFAFSWMPLYILFCVVKFSDFVLYNRNYQLTIDMLLPIAQWLGASNSCINPILYVFMNKKFRLGFKNILQNYWCRRISRRHQQVSFHRNAAESTSLRNIILKTESTTNPPRCSNNVHLHNDEHCEMIELVNTLD